MSEKSGSREISDEDPADESRTADAETARPSNRGSGSDPSLDRPLTRAVLTACTEAQIDDLLRTTSARSAQDVRALLQHIARRPEPYMAAPLIEAAAKLAESRELAPDLFRSMECVIGRHTDSMRYHIADELRRTPHLREDVSNLVLELDRIILTYLDEWPPDSPSDLGHRMAAAYTKARSLSGKVGYDDRGLIQRDHESLGTSLDRALSLSVNERVPGLSKLQGLSDLACVVSTDRTPRLLTDLVRAHPPPDGGAFAESYLRAVAIAVSRKNDPDAASDLAELLTRDFEPGSGREIRDPRARFGAVLVLASTQRLPESAIRRLKSCAESHERHAKLIDRILEHGRTD